MTTDTPSSRDESSLSEAQKRDLQDCVNVYRLTVGTYDFPNGRYVALRTGKSLEKMGLVRLANRHTPNRYKGWIPTEQGIELADAFV